MMSEIAVPDYVHKANAAKAKSEAAKADAETREALARARTAEIALEREEHKRIKEISADEFYRVYRILGSISDESVKACINQLSIWNRTQPGCDITLILQSPGGSIVPGMALWDYLQELRAQNHHLTTIARGYAASMAGILLQAGDIRIIGRESWLLIHEASFGAMGSFGDVEDVVEWIRKIQDRILDIFASRSKLSKAQIKRRWHRKDWWISSNEALKLGFVDEIR